MLTFVRQGALQNLVLSLHYSSFAVAQFYCYFFSLEQLINYYNFTVDKNSAGFAI